MRLHLRIRDLPDGAELLDYVEHRARLALGRFSARIHTLYVTLTDENGPRGGIDKNCCVTARVQGLPSITVSSRDVSTRRAVDRALARIARSVRRALDVRQEPRFRGTWPSLEPPGRSNEVLR